MRDFSLQFFLKVGDLLITIPVNPEELEINKEVGYDTYSNLDKKEILKLQEDKLIELELESILEQTVSSASVVDKPWTPNQYLNMFNGWKDNRTIVRVTSSDGQIDFEGYIVGVSTMYEGGTDDYGYALTIIQERSIELLTNVDNGYTKIDIEYQVLRYTPQTNPTTPTNTNNSTNNTSNSNNSQSVTYTVKSGDTLSGIARMYYGNSSKWPDIFNANKDKIKNANLIYPGQVLTIPNSDGTVKSSTSSSSTKSTSNKTTTQNINKDKASYVELQPAKTGNENKSFYKKINGIEFWGQAKLAEYNNRYTTYFHPESKTYGRYDSRVSNSEYATVGYIKDYVYFGGTKVCSKEDYQ